MTPQEELAALRRMAELEAKAGGVQQYGPGPGKPSPAVPSARARQAELETIRAGQPGNPVGNFLTGNLYGVQGSGLGALQAAAHTLPDQPQDSWLYAGTPEGPDRTKALDEHVARWGAQRDSDPAMQTGAGAAGNFTGSMVATAPLAALSVPAKGASVLSWLARGAAGGGVVAGSEPVTSGNFVEQKGKQVAAGATIGAVVPAVLRGGMSAGERLYGPNAMAQVANWTNTGANKKPFAKEGEELAERTGVRMTPGQVSGGKTQTALENMSRQSIFSADRAFEADQKVAGDTIRYLDRIMDNVTKNPASEASIGTQIQAATRGAVVKIAEKRESQAAADYGALDKALGGRKFVQPDNAMAEADAIIRDYQNVAGPEAARIVKQAEAIKAQFGKNGGLSFTEAQRSRTYYGRGARGAANVFDEVNPDINRRIATRLFKAFDADIEASASRAGSNNLGPGIVPNGYFKGQLGGGNQGIVDAIRNANANYRRYSQLIEATESHPIARLFGDHVKLDDVLEFDKIPPETVITRLGQMKPTELGMVRNFMEKQAPEAWQQYKRLMIEKAVDAARTLPTSAGANTVPFNASQFVRTLGGDKPDKIKQLQAVFGASEMRELDDAFRVARRLGDNFGRNNSGTGPYNEAMSFFESLKSRSVQAIASTGGEAMGLRKIANVMLHAEGRRALIQLSKLPPTSRQAASLIGLIGSLAAGKGSQRGNDQQRSNGPQPVGGQRR